MENRAFSSCTLYIKQSGEVRISGSAEIKSGYSRDGSGPTAGEVITIINATFGRSVEGAVTMTQNSRHTAFIFKLLAAILVTAFTAPVLAQTSTDEALTLEEVIVTATKREQNLQDVPIAISVISAADIEAAGFTTLSNITRAVPNLAYVEPTAPLFVEYTIRGFSTTGNNAGIDPGVGVYVDGVYLGRGIAFDGVLMDIERVEVLKGP